MLDESKDEWRNRAACIGVDTEVFFPAHRVHEDTAMRICAGCPVRAECLEAALDEERPTTSYGFSYGVRGGKTGHARRMLLQAAYPSTQKRPTHQVSQRVGRPHAKG